MGKKKTAGICLVLANLIEITLLSDPKKRINMQKEEEKKP